MAPILFSDTVFWADTAVRLACDGVLLAFTLHALYRWRKRAVTRQHFIRFGLLLSGRFLNMLDSIDFYGVKIFPPELGLFTVALQTGGDLLVGVMFALAYFTVMLNTAKFNRTVKMGVPHAARLSMLSLVAIYNVGYMVCVILAITTHSPSPALGALRILTGVCTSGCCASGAYIIWKVVLLIDTEGAVNIRKKFIRLLVIILLAAVAMLGQQVQSGLAFLGPVEYHSARDYFPANPVGPRIDSYNLFAVIDNREFIVLSEVEYGFSWYFASLLRLVYVPMFIFAAYPTKAGSGSRTKTTTISRPSTTDTSVDEPSTKSKTFGKKVPLSDAVELSIALVPATPNPPLIVVPDNDPPITKPPSPNSPHSSLHSPKEIVERRSSHLETPEIAPTERRSSDHALRQGSDTQRRSVDVSEAAKLSPSPKGSRKLSSSLTISPRVHGTKSAEPSPRKPNSPSHSRHVLPGAHSGHIRLVDEEDEDVIIPERKPSHQPREEYQRLENFVEGKEGKDGERDIENIE